MVQAAETDVVGPAVATQDPDALLDQVVGHGGQASRLHAGQGLELAAKDLDPLALLGDAGLGGLIGLEDRGHQIVPQLGAELAE